MTVHCCVCVNVNTRNPCKSTKRVGRYEACELHAELLERNNGSLIESLMEIRGKRCGPRNAT